MKVYQTKEIRNIALVGSSKSGKTTLAESMLFQGGMINRRGSVEDKNTVSDYKEIELEKQNSITSTVLYVEYGGIKINIIDTPGFSDFIGDVISALTVADTALLVVNAQNGIEVGTEISWRYINKFQKPVIFAINHLDHEKAKFNDTIRQIKEEFGKKVTLVQYPVNTGSGFEAVIDLISMKMVKFSSEDGKSQIVDIPDSEKEKAEKLRATLIEAAAEGSEELMEKYFDTETLTVDEIKKGIKLGLLNRGIFPVLCLSAKENKGVANLLEFINDSVPLPTDMPAKKTSEGKELSCKSDDSTSLFVFKTSVEPHLGIVSYFKVYGGEVSEGMDLVNANKDSKERITQLFIMAGKIREKVEKVFAGDIAATIKLKDTKTNDTLNSIKNNTGIIDPIIFPEPIYFTAIKAVNSSDDEKLSAILNEMHDIDPTLHIQFFRELKQLILSGQGELHINTVKWHFDNIYKIDIKFFPPKIPYRETITKPAKASYRHKKQSGGAGQFGEVYMLIQPYKEGMAVQKEFPIRKKDEVNLEWGGKLIMNNCIVGGAIDARFMPAIMKGLMEKMEDGPLTGSYARDIVVNIYDGKMHPVDSNEISFKLAARHAFSDAFKNADPKILEPIYDVEVIVPEEMMGNVMTDLQGRRAVIMGMDNEGKYQIIKAKVPLAEMNRYSTALSSLTSGRATYTMKFAEYSQVPGDIQKQLLKDYQEKQKKEE